MRAPGHRNVRKQIDLRPARRGANDFCRLETKAPAGVTGRPWPVATTIHGLSIPGSIRTNPAGLESSGRARRLSRQSRRALRILAHAIEYVANEFLRESIPPGPNNARLQAVKLLMAADREVCAGSSRD